MMKLRDMLTNQTVKLNVEVSDWEEAVRVGGEMLVDVEACTREYIEAIIETIKSLGPYVVIAPGIAIPHARPEYGALRSQFSLLTLKTPVNFGVEDLDPVNILFSMSATTAQDHVESLKQVANLCMEDEAVRKLGEAQTIEDIIKLIENENESSFR